MSAPFRFKQFEVFQDNVALKVGTDAVLLGAVMSIPSITKMFRALDVGTGSGVIALMAAQRLAGADSGDWKIEAIDIDAPSIGDASFNFSRSPWSEHLSAQGISLAEYASRDCGFFDHIFSNPPFYDNSLRNPDARESAARHTESLSFRDILSFASVHLTCQTGILSLILPSECEKDLVRSAVSFGLRPFRIIDIHTTAAKAPRRIVMEFQKSTSPLELSREKLVLQDGPLRTAQYSELTAEFYL